MKQQIKIHFLIAIFLLGHAHISAQELAPSKGAYKPGEDVVISFSGGPGNAKDWVGIYNEGQTPGDVNSTDYKYVDGKTSGELVFDPLPVGKYEAHLLENDGYEILASTTFEVSDEVDVPKVSLSKAEYEIGEVIEISFSGGPGNKLDWIGVYQEGQTPGEVSSTDFEYVGGKTSGSFVFDSLPVGKYEAHLFEDDSYDILATESFNIKEAPVANKAPVVVDRSLEVNEEGSVSITLTGSDEDGDDLSFTVLSQPKNGALSGTAPNLTYSPKANYSGSDSFTFKASDGKADSNTATVTITVAEKVEEVQVSMSKNAYEIGELIEVNFSGGPGNAKDWLAIYGAAYDQPIEGFVNSFAYVDGTQNGITGKKSGTVYFKNGLPQGTYKVSLLENASSKILATAVFEIKPAEVKIQLSKIEYEPGEEIEISFSGGPGNKLDWIGVYQEGQQEISLWWYVDGTKDGNVGKASGVITVQLDLAVGSYKASLLENNEAKILATASFNIKEAAVVNKAPVVVDRSVEVNKEESVSVTLTGSDEDEDVLSFTVLSQPKNGTLSGAAPALTYSPKANYSGSDSFTFKANDGKADSNTATVSISVASVNDKPVVAGQSVEVKEDGTVSITLTGSDEDGDDLSITVLSQPKNGTLSGTGPDFTYSPKANYSGSDSFTFKANDGKADSNTATVSISVASVNDKPVVAGQSVGVKEDGTVSITLTGSDEDGDDLSFTVLSQPKNGTLSGTGPDFTYSPKANYSGSDSFTFRANDGKADSNTATVSISVASVNDKPVVAGQSVEVKEDGNVSITLTGSDEDGDDLSFSVLSQPKNGTLSGTAPALTYSPKTNYSGSDSFTFRANDGSDDSKTATIMISVIEHAVDKVILTLSKAVYEEGEQIEISYSGAHGNAKDWVGIYIEGQKPGDYDSVQYQYLNGKTSGVLIFDPSTEHFWDGKYEVHLFADNSYQKLYTAHFNVLKAGSPWVTTSRSKYDFGETIVISYVNGPGNQNDWIGLHEEGKEGTWPAIKHQKLKGEKSGTLEWDVTLEKGKKYNITLYEHFSLKIIRTAEFTISTKNIVAPIARSQKLNARAGKEYKLRLKGSDADGDELTYIIAAQPKHGTLSGTAPNLIYTSNADYAGSDSFTYIANDGEMNSKTATVNFEISDSKPSKWTILFYLATDNDQSIDRLNKAKIINTLRTNEDVQIITQYDADTSHYRVKNWLSEGNSKELVTGTKRFVAGLTVNGKTPLLNDAIVESIDESSPTHNRNDDPAFLRDFLEWGMTNYPAERYGIVFSDHGGSFHGFGGDNQDGLGGKSQMKPYEFREAIQGALDTTGVEKFEFINFMACLMGASEVLEAFQGICDVFYGNPEVSYSGNVQMRFKYIRSIMNDPNISNRDLAVIEANNWTRGHIDAEVGGGSHVAYDMSKYESFKKAFKKFSEDLVEDLRFSKNNNPIISGARRNSTHYWAHENYPDLKKPTKYIDLAHFAELLTNNVDGNLKSSSDVLVYSISDMIIDKFIGTKRPAVSGLSIFYPINGLGDRKDQWDSTNFASGTGFTWGKFLREVRSTSKSGGQKNEFVLNDDGTLVSRSTEFGLVESGLMSATEKRPVTIQFELESADNAYDYFINLVSNRETDDPNQFVYLGELHRGLIDEKKKHQYNWDTKLPVLSLEGGGAKAPPVGSVGVDRKELIGEMPLYLGGWWSELSNDLMVSYADYQGPGEEEKTHLILMTKYLEGGAGILDSVMLDSSLEDTPPDGAGESENQTGPEGVDFEFEPGAKLWPVYYMEEPDSGNPGEWKPYFTWFKDGYIKIPENGKDSLVINWVGVEPGDYRAEVQVSDFYGNLSEELKFDIRVEEDIQGLPSLMLTLEGARVVLSWGMEDSGDEAILQWVDGLGGEWADVPSSDLGFGGAGRLYKENANDETKFYRLIKK